MHVFCCFSFLCFCCCCLCLGGGGGVKCGESIPICIYTVRCMVVIFKFGAKNHNRCSFIREIFHFSEISNATANILTTLEEAVGTVVP